MSKSRFAVGALAPKSSTDAKRDFAFAVLREQFAPWHCAAKRTERGRFYFKPQDEQSFNRLIGLLRASRKLSYMAYGLRDSNERLVVVL